MILYLLKFFPKLSEAFILDELCEVKRRKIPLRVWALGRWPDDDGEHPEVTVVQDDVEYLDQDGAGRFRKGIALTRLFVGAKNRVKRAKRILREEHADHYGYIYTESLPRAVRLRKLGVTHIHAHFMSEAADHALALSLLSGIPFSVTAHGSDILLYPHPHLGLIAEHATAIFTASQYNRKHLLAEGVREDKIRVIPNGVDTNAFRAADRADRSAGDPPHLLTVARLTPVKGIDVLLRAYAKLDERGVKFRATIVGSGRERARLVALRNKLGLVDVVNFAGDQPRDAVHRAYGDADLFVLASRSEGFPVSVLEAMASGLPVVAPDITGLPEQIEQGAQGRLFPAEDSSALADTLEELLIPANRDALRAMGKAARERAVHDFALAHTVDMRLAQFDAPPAQSPRES